MRGEAAGLLMKIAAAITALLMVAACATYPPRSEAERTADYELAARVDQALAHDPDIYARHIEVDARQGVVRLTGYVWSSNDFYEAKRVAANVPGVTSVVSQLEMMVGGRTGSR